MGFLIWEKHKVFISQLRKKPQSCKITQARYPYKQLEDDKWWQSHAILTLSSKTDIICHSPPRGSRKAWRTQQSLLVPVTYQSCDFGQGTSFLSHNFYIC